MLEPALGFRREGEGARAAGTQARGVAAVAALAGPRPVPLPLISSSSNTRSRSTPERAAPAQVRLRSRKPVAVSKQNSVVDVSPPSVRVCFSKVPSTQLDVKDGIAKLLPESGVLVSGSINSVPAPGWNVVAAVRESLPSKLPVVAIVRKCPRPSKSL